MHKLLLRVKLAEKDLCVGTNAHRIAARFGRKQQGQVIRSGRLAERLLRVTRLAATRSGLQPDLQEVHRLLRRRIEFAVEQAVPGADVLQVARLDDAAVAHAIVVLQLAVDDIAEDLRVTMRMLTESLASFHYVVVDDAQGSKAHVIGIEIVAERERVPAATSPARFASARPRG